jgi:putative peptidoglycan lipid II flippase
MSQQLHKKSIVMKTLQVGAATFLSRMIAILREILMVKFLGIGALSDAFIAAFRFPNIFRHVFAEGALSASFVPVYVKALKQHERKDADGLMTATMLFVEGFILLFYAGILLFPNTVVWFIAPGFTAAQVEYTALFLKILFPFLAFVSAGALLGGALNAMNQFFIPAFGPALWNVLYVISLVLCMHFELAASFLCFGVLFAGIVQFLMSLITYYGYELRFSSITPAAKMLFKQVLTKFFPCLFGVSIIEINLLVSGQIASFLPAGSVSLLYYGSRFMNLPLGVFGVALSNILLPHFSRVVLYAPSRFNFYLLKVAKFVTWVMFPVAILFMIASENLFTMIFMFSKKVTLAHVMEAKWILVIYCMGLVFFAFNKILLSLFYSLKDTTSATIASAIAAVINLSIDLVALYLGSIYVIAAATVASGLGMTIVSLYFLSTKHKIHFYARRYLLFLMKFGMQFLAIGGLFCVAFYGSEILLVRMWPTSWLLGILGFWVRLGIASAGCAYLYFTTRHFFKIKLHFID